MSYRVSHRRREARFRAPAGFLFALLLLLSSARPTSGGMGVHDVTPATQFPEGPCGECHVAHAATRKWKPAPVFPTTGWYTEEISRVCVVCHSAGNPFGARDVTGTAFHPGSHGSFASMAPPPPGNPSVPDLGSVRGSGLPHAGKPRLQCTSCHNVHSDGYRPFLNRKTVGELCDSCHPGRASSSVRAANAAEGGDNVSTHPVNVPNADLTGSGQASILSVAELPAALKTPLVPAPGYVLGGKLSEGADGVITCGTCHAVHGSGGAPGTKGLLAVDNRGDDPGVPGSPLCSSCHRGGYAGGQVGAPGTTDHPVDNVTGRLFSPGGVRLPAEWVSGRLDRPAATFNAARSGGAGTPRCSSCHDAHGGIGGTSLLRSPVPASARGEWCWSCHPASQAAPKLHHSSRSTYPLSAIACGDCHGKRPSAQAQWTAHNGFASFAVGPDTNSATPVEDTAATMYNVPPNGRTWERLCEHCHLADNPTRFVAARNLGTVTFPARHGNPTGTQTHLSSYFTHSGGAVYIQDVDRTYNTYLRAGQGGAGGWGKAHANAGSHAGADIYSKYANYGANATPQNPQTLVNGAYVVCESCHNLLTNAGIPKTTADETGGYLANLLVRRYEDDGSGAKAGAGSAAVGDGLCRGCHSSAPIAAGDLDNPPLPASYVHYPEAHTANPALFLYPQGLAPYGRSVRTILTAYDNAQCPNTTSADADGAPGVFSYPNTNRLDCDSCHRPHNAEEKGDNGIDFTTANAATVSRYILEPGSATSRNAAKAQTCVQCHDSQRLCGY